MSSRPAEFGTTRGSETLLREKLQRGKTDWGEGRYRGRMAVSSLLSPCLSAFRCDLGCAGGKT